MTSKILSDTINHFDSSRDKDHKHYHITNLSTATEWIPCTSTNIRDHNILFQTEILLPAFISLTNKFCYPKMSGRLLATPTGPVSSLVNVLFSAKIYIGRMLCQETEVTLYTAN